jgi:hypothetical protein
MTAVPLPELAAQATFIFRGTVERLNASTMAPVAVSESTAVVNVDEVIQAPAALGDLTGRQVTIQFGESPPTPAGRQAIFFTRPWLYGDSIAVVEVGRRQIGARATKAEITGARQEVADVTERKPDQELQRHIGEADGVVAGRVVNTQPAAGMIPRVSEHDPGWQEAVVAVESVEMGDLPQPTVTVLFASSMDVMWFQAPKLHVGSEGVWVLHRGEAAGVPAAAWACVHPEDELPKEQLGRVRGVIAAIREASG